LVKSLVAIHHASNLHGEFNTPVGAIAAGPIGPGQSFDYSFTAAPGMKLFSTIMFGQSIYWFYSPDAEVIALFHAKGNPVTEDITNKFVVWDAGTEDDEEIGIGPNQGPRQPKPNTGEDEHGVVMRVKDARWTNNAQFFRVTITAEAAM